MADLEFYKLSMTGAEADGGIRVGMDIGALTGIPYSNGNNEILVAVPGEDYGYPLLQGNGPPTADTAANFGQHYYDLSATKPPFEYICIAFSETGGFVWRQHNDAGYYLATYGTTTYQDIIKNYNLGKVCIVVDNNNDIYYLGQVDTNLLTFYRAFRSVSSPQDGARIEYKNVRVTSTNTWSSFFYYAENAANRTQVINEQSTDTQYPTAKAVYTYGQSIDAAAQGYANAAEEAAKGYTDEQLEPVADAADKAEEYALGAYVTPTASGAVASFDDGAEDIPVKSLVVNIEPVQDLNGYANPWPPGGGKNILAPWVTTQTLEGITWTVNEDGTFTSSGTATNSSQQFSPKFSLPTGEYILTGCPTGGSYSTYLLKALLYNNSTLIGDASDYGRGINFTITEDVTDILVFASVASGVTAPTDTWKPMIRLATETDASYSPYSNICPISGWDSVRITREGANSANSQSYNISLEVAGTVYGGSLDVTTGVLTVNRATIRADAIPWRKSVNQRNPNGTYFIINTYVPFVGWADGGHDNALCNALKKASLRGLAASEENNTFWWNDSSSGWRCIWGEVGTSTLEQFVQFLTDNDVVFSSILAAPVTYQLTPTEVSTLLGYNAISAEAGSVKVTYRADPTIIYNKLTAAIISSGGTV